MMAGTTSTQSKGDHLPEPIAAAVISGRDVAGNKVSFELVIFRPVEVTRDAWRCLYQVRSGSTIVAGAEAPGTDGISALYGCFVMLARAVDHLREARDLRWMYHDAWWVRHIIPHTDEPPGGPAQSS